MPSLSLIDICFKYQEKYAQKYGPKTVVFIQKGTFYEAYATDTEGCDIKKIESLLSIKLTRSSTKKNVPVSREVPYMIGIPVIATYKYVNMLIDANFTVILYDECSEDGIISRNKAGLYTKGIYPDKNETSHILSIYLVEEKQMKNNGSMLACGIAIVEITTGKSIVHEVHSSVMNENYAIDEIKSIMEYYTPKEVIIHYQPNGMNRAPQIIKRLNFKEDFYVKFITYPSHANDLNILTEDFFRINYQNQFLGTIYNMSNSSQSVMQMTKQNKLSALEILKLENKMYATIALLILLEYVKEHNKFLVAKMEPPENYTKDKHLILGNNATEQLHLLTTHLESYTKIRSLFDVVNETCTPMGKRFLKESLINPLSQENKDEINTRYDWIQWMLKKNRFETIRPLMMQINDLEMLHRKLTMGVLVPKDFFKLDTYYKAIKKIFSFLDDSLRENIFSEKMNNLFLEYREEYKECFVVSKMNAYPKMNEIQNVYREGLYPKIDKLQMKVNYIFVIINQLRDYLNEMIGGNDSNKFVQLKCTKSKGYHFTLSTGKAKMLEKALAKKKEIIISTPTTNDETKVEANDLVFEFSGKQSKIMIRTLKNYDGDLVDLQQMLFEKVRAKYLYHLSHFDYKYRKMFLKMSRAISYIDFLLSGAIVANKYSYCQPIIKSDDNISSFIDCKQIRNPLFERTNRESAYIGHDIALGNVPNKENCNGMLLFGVNSSGKSNLMKAIGMNVVLAQIGYFVAGEKFKYEPYMGIYARITGNDNGFMGLSSYELEMIELDVIIKQAKINGDRNLFIGDEVCKSTETDGAMALVASSLIMLSKYVCSFVFASHFHRLVDLEEIKEVKNMKICHLLVSHDPKTNEFIYDRILRDGEGPRDYALEVARHRIKDKEFMELATKIKKSIVSDKYDVSKKKSKYNNDLIVHECAICKYKPGSKHDRDLETHHINFQKDCYKNKVIATPHIAMNDLSNLVILCRPCHKKVHNKEISIKGYLKTSNGKKIDYTE